MTEQPPRKDAELLDAVLKPFVDKTEELWAQMFSHVLGSEKFAEGIGQALKGQLLFQRAFQDQLERYFKTLNLPTRGDLDTIARDLGELKALVGRLEARLGVPKSSAARSRARKRVRSESGTVGGQPSAGATDA